MHCATAVLHRKRHCTRSHCPALRHSLSVHLPCLVCVCACVFASRMCYGVVCEAMAKRTYSNSAAQGHSKSEIPENGPKRNKVSNGGGDSRLWETFGDSRLWETLADGVSPWRHADDTTILPPYLHPNKIWPSSGNWNPCDEDVNAQIERAWREGKTVVAVTSGPRHWQYEFDLVRLVQLGTFYPETCSGDILVTGVFPTPSYTLYPIPYTCTLYLYPIPYALCPPYTYTLYRSSVRTLPNCTPHPPYPIPRGPGPGPRGRRGVQVPRAKFWGMWGLLRGLW